MPVSLWGDEMGSKQYINDDNTQGKRRVEDNSFSFSGDADGEQSIPRWICSHGNVCPPTFIGSKKLEDRPEANASSLCDVSARLGR